jgi:hypothetical protein
MKGRKERRKGGSERGREGRKGGKEEGNFGGDGNVLYLNWGVTYKTH